MSEGFDRLKTALEDRYRIERELGRGGMATVYLAEDLKHHRPVAVKVLRPELAAAIGPERFLREIEITAGLDHPHILALLDSGEANGFPFYVMPYVEGESLRDRLNREKQLAIDDAIQITREVAGALDFAHRQGIVHRDIKPENILLTAGHARVADFGIARALSAAGGDRLTETGAAIGTPHYMSPEQASGGQVDGRTDIYALACVLYEMLGGDPPFTGSSAQAVLARKVVDQVPSLRTLRDTVSEPVERVVMKALAKAPADRHGTAGQMAEELRRAAREEAVEGTGPPRRRVRPRAALALPVLAAVTVALWLGFKAVGRDELPITHLAILPLENLTGDTEQEYLVEGIHSELIAALGRIPALTVISRSSVMPFKDQQKALPDIAAELNVQALVEGSVFLAGDTVRVMAQLVQAVPEERQLWAQSYDGSLSSPFALLDRTAGAIAEQIQVTLTLEERSLPTAERGLNSEAYHLVKKGQHQYRMGWIREAAASFEQALDRDTSYAPAYVGLATISNARGYFDTAVPGNVYPQARVAALKALELDETLAEAHEQLAWTRAVFDWDWPGAEGEFRRALTLNPGSARGHLWYAFLLHWQRRYAEAVTELDRALELTGG
jgi:serine/threonine-protein kinase